MTSAPNTTLTGSQQERLATARLDFPILEQKVRNNQRLVYLDNAATTLKPAPVIKQLSDHYLFGASNIHRGVHYLSETATSLYEGVRRKVAQFIGATNESEVVFTTGTTGGINLLAYSFAPLIVERGDEIILTEMEHHANIVPWQMLRDRIGCTIKVARVNDDGSLDCDHFRSLLTDRTKIASFTHTSNAIGTVNPVGKLVAICREHGVVTIVDAAQSIAHDRTNVNTLGCDFLVFSGHKMLAPSGIGILWGRRELLAKMPPFIGGGDMIRSVTFEKTTFADPPARFEAGTPGIGVTIALGAAIDYIESIGFELIKAQENALLTHATREMRAITGLRIIGDCPGKAPIISFTVEGIHPHDVGSLLDERGVAIRAGHHCAQPLMRRFNVPATSRASFAFYNTREDVDALVAAIRRAQEIFS